MNELPTMIAASISIAGAIGLLVASYLTVRSNMNKTTLEMLEVQNGLLRDQIKDAIDKIRLLENEIRVVRQLPLEHISSTLNKLVETQNKMIETQNIILNKLEQK